MRASGILMPISSLPSKGGIGCFSKEAYEFADRLREAGQTYWQILPLGPTGYGDSPYQPFSAFAGNPYFIDLYQLQEEGLLTGEELEAADSQVSESKVEYGLLYERRYRALHQAYARFEKTAEYAAFVEEERDWLENYALYMAVKEHFGQKSWLEWEEDLRLRDPGALEACRESFREQIGFYEFLQYEFFRQWKKLKAYVNAQGIRIIGDIPIYVAMDSADSWSEPQLFQYDADCRPIRVAGCPPDAFAADGQLWGNPLYSWDYHEETGYAWWKRRMAHCFRLYDVVRVDHFRGFDEYFAIPYGDKTAAGGSWQPGPGMKLFAALKAEFGEVPIIAEDLGYLTDTVIQLVADTGYPSMKVMEFAFDSREAGDYMPYHYPHNCVVYTGTHDNQTLKGWFEELSDEDRQKLDDYLELAGRSEDEKVWSVIRLTLGTVADTAIVPMQDYLCLGREARMNQPSTMGSNWCWRMTKDQFTPELAGKIAGLT
ncbi:MAG: 4-alpha-glucanotransferase, partial [Lachnospiraceae bacterium]|nr:4-alpha-glucanotransferase [Lachnospiraceae bacterium]